MNARDGRFDILTQSPTGSKSVNSHYDIVVQHLQQNSALIYALVTLVLVYLSLGYFGFVPLGVPPALWNIIGPFDDQAHFKRFMGQCFARPKHQQPLNIN